MGRILCLWRCLSAGAAGARRLHPRHPSSLLAPRCEIMATMPVACEHSQCLELETSVGLRTFHLWVARDGSHFFVVKDAPPPAIALLATLEAAADGVACEISFLTSGRSIAEFTQAVPSEKPLLMGHLRMSAFIAAHEMGLLESIYQKVEVLLSGFQQPLRDGVLLWRGSANFSAPRKGRRPMRLQQALNRPWPCCDPGRRSNCGTWTYIGILTFLGLPWRLCTARIQAFASFGGSASSASAFSGGTYSGGLEPS